MNKSRGKKRNTEIDVLMEKSIEKFTISSHFSKTITLGNEAIERSRGILKILLFLDFFLAVLYFAFGNLYHRLISFMTKYYPFSLLYTDRLFHYENVPIRNLMIEVEDLIKKSGTNVLIIKGSRLNDMAEFYVDVDSNIKINDKLIGKIEALLQKEYGTVFVRKDKKILKLQIPWSVFSERISLSKYRIFN